MPTTKKQRLILIIALIGVLSVSAILMYTNTTSADGKVSSETIDMMEKQGDIEKQAVKIWEKVDYETPEGLIVNFNMLVQSYMSSDNMTEKEAIKTALNEQIIKESVYAKAKDMGFEVTFDEALSFVKDTYKDAGEEWQAHYYETAKSVGMTVDEYFKYDANKKVKYSTMTPYHDYEQGKYLKTNNLTQETLDQDAWQNYWDTVIVPTAVKEYSDSTNVTILKTCAKDYRLVKEAVERSDLKALDVISELN